MRRAHVVAFRVACLALAVAAAAWAHGAYGAVYVAGGSMSPALAKGDLAIVRRGPIAAKVGDVLLVEKDGWPAGVLHRVVAVDFDGGFHLRGDANPTPDLDPVHSSSVRGVVTLVVPTGRLLGVVEALARMVQSRVT